VTKRVRRGCRHTEKGEVQEGKVHCREQVPKKTNYGEGRRTVGGRDGGPLGVSGTSEG